MNHQAHQRRPRRRSYCKPPTPYFGGKARLAPRIVELMPRHRCYIEPFFGAGAVFFAKPRARVEIINDIDDAIVAFFRCLRDRPNDLARVCALTPHARSEHRRAAIATGLGDLETARRWWTRVHQGIGSKGTHANGWSISEHQAHGAAAVRAVHRFDHLAERLSGVAIECQPAVELITRRARRPDTLVYADPPYLGSTRKTSRTGDYRHDMADEASHRELAEVLHTTEAAVLLSGYPSPLYDELYADWARIEIPTKACTSNAGGGRPLAPRTEVIWSNRPIEQASHG